MKGTGVVSKRKGEHSLWKFPLQGMCAQGKYRGKNRW